VNGRLISIIGVALVLSIIALPVWLLFHFPAHRLLPAAISPSFDQTTTSFQLQGTRHIPFFLPQREDKGYFSKWMPAVIDPVVAGEQAPLQYTHLYQERGIHLTTPVTSGDEANLSYRIAGTVDRTAQAADKTDYLIVQTRKGKEKATYVIPVRDYRFDSSIWFRFGPGEYRVNLFVPEVTEQTREYFRFYTIASFSVISHVQQDLRDLLPARGIESDHSQIQQLAYQLTLGQTTDRGRAEAIYRYISRNMHYDVEKMKKNRFAWDDSALKIMSTGSGICQDFSFLAIALLRSIHIPARFVEGSADGQRHAWVEVWVGNRWLTMDPTWGAGYVTPTGNFVKRYDPAYFDPPASTFQRTHKRVRIVY
jgi:hypothetical protein